MTHLSLDFETYSEVDIKKVGAHRYMEDPAFEVLLCAYAYDDAPVTVVDLASGEQLPDRVLKDFADDRVVKHAYNCAFERNVIQRRWGIYCDPAQWQDTMILVAVCGLPLALGDASAALGLPVDKAKDRRGTQLINFFCKPCKPTKANAGATRNYPQDAPDKWAEFIEYNRQDVVAERHIRKLLEKWAPDESEHRFWCLDQKINDNGMRIDPQLVKSALAMDARCKAELLESAIKLTGMQNPNSVAQVKAWLEAEDGTTVATLNKKAVDDVVKSLKSEKAKEFMSIRWELSKSSTKKYQKMQDCMCPDEHIKGCFQFYGSHTGRFAGRLVQLQNLPQNHIEDLATARALVRAGDYETVDALYGSVAGTLSELLRTALIPEPGCRFVVVDYSAIEARVIAWFAQEQWRLKVFEAGGDIYCASASQMFKVPVEKHGVNSHLRQKGKIAELALGYGGTVGALKAFGADELGMTEAEMQETVDRWRKASPRIVQLWRSIDRAAKACITNRMTTNTGNVQFRYTGGTLWMRLPSGRWIAYPAARIEENSFGTASITYMKKANVRVDTYGPRLVENLVQATARDCLKEAMLAIDAAGYDIRGHVHDEVIVSVPIGTSSVEEIAEIMGRPLSWAPGLPLRGDGFECEFYIKD